LLKSAASNRWNAAFFLFALFSSLRRKLRRVLSAARLLSIEADENKRRKRKIAPKTRTAANKRARRLLKRRF